MFGAIAGHDPRDAGTAKVPVDDYTGPSARGVQGLRIGVMPDYFFPHLQPPVEAAVRAALERSRPWGRVRRRPGREHPRQHLGAAHRRVMRAEHLSPALVAGATSGLRRRRAPLLEVGELHLATHYLQAQRYRSLLRAEFLDAFRSVDVFICPTLPFTATRSARCGRDRRRRRGGHALGHHAVHGGASADRTAVAERALRLRRRACRSACRSSARHSTSRRCFGSARHSRARRTSTLAALHSRRPTGHSIRSKSTTPAAPRPSAVTVGEGRNVADRAP